MYQSATLSRSFILLRFLACGAALLVAFSGCTKESSTEPSPTPVDTTSHNFQWEFFAFGDGSPSQLYDISIVNDTLAYAVGEIYNRDSAGQWEPHPHNVARWNGSTWQTMIVPFEVYGGSTGYGPILAVLAFAKDDVWMFSKPGSYLHWDGHSWTSHWISAPTGTVLCMWGTSSQDFYLGGSNGSLTHFNGSTWQPLPTGTSLSIYNIYGVHNPATGEADAYAVASQLFITFDKRILHITGYTVTPVSYDSIRGSLTGVWFDPGRAYYVAGSGLFRKGNPQDSGLWKECNATQYFSFSVSGNAANDVIVCGSKGDLAHFNGADWKSYLPQTQFSGEYNRVAMKGNLVIAVGLNGATATAVVGRR